MPHLLLKVARHVDRAASIWSLSASPTPTVPERWRVSPQWVGLIRSHAELIAHETEWLAAFDVGCGQCALLQPVLCLLFGALDLAALLTLELKRYNADNPSRFVMR